MKLSSSVTKSAKAIFHHVSFRPLRYSRHYLRILTKCLGKLHPAPSHLAGVMVALSWDWVDLMDALWSEIHKI